MFMPSHFLIADRHGESFVWEYSQAHNREHIVESPGRPLISTNFRLHQHMDGENPPSVTSQGSLRALLRARRKDCRRARQTDGGLHRKHHKAVDMVLPGVLYGGKTPIRTLWHALYFPEQRKMRVSFYLGGGTGPERLRPQGTRTSGVRRTGVRVAARRRTNTPLRPGMSVDAHQKRAHRIDT